jgi:hypothetical protein
MASSSVCNFLPFLSLGAFLMDDNFSKGLSKFVALANLDHALASAAHQYIEATTSQTIFQIICHIFSGGAAKIFSLAFTIASQAFLVMILASFLARLYHHSLSMLTISQVAEASHLTKAI